MNNRKGSFMQTFSKKIVYPLDPKEEEICIEDIAHALSMLCRFTGHSNYFYSVCEHSLLVASLLPDDLKLTGLLHDATEAYINDLSRPLKKSLPEYKEIELRLQEVIARKFNLVYPFPELIKEVDDAVLMAEQIVMMGEQVQPWPEQVAPAFVPIRCYQPATAELLFLKAYYDYQTLLTLKEAANIIV
jgi:hypothetical protein